MSIEVIGKNGVAKIMTDFRNEDGSIDQIKSFMDSSLVLNKEASVRVMADYHNGKGCVIGFTHRQTLDDDIFVSPNIVGVDIGCRVSSIKLDGIKKENIDFDSLDKFIRKNIALGAGNYIPPRENDWVSDLVDKFCDIMNIKLICNFDSLTGQLDSELDKEGIHDKIKLAADVKSQFGSLGGGNHFISLNEGSDGNIWLSVHGGSRNFGHVVADLFQKRAGRFCKDSLVPEQLKYFKGSVDRDDEESNELMNYIKFTISCQTFSYINHLIILKKISEFFGMNLDVKNENEKVVFLNDNPDTTFLTTQHNYLEFNEKSSSNSITIRKGAISAMKDERLLIPLNMRDGIILGRGLGNKDYNFSAPHGAGRVMSRSKAKKMLNLDDVKKDMKDSNVFTTSLDYALDEAPDAYKPASQIINDISKTVIIDDILKEIYNIKGK